MIVVCQNCSKKLKVPDSAVGKKAKCPACGTQILLTAEAAVPEKPATSRERPVDTDAPASAERRVREKSKRPDAADRPRRSSAAGQPAPPRRQQRQRPERNPYADDFEDLPYDDDFDEAENPYAAPKAGGQAGKRKGKRGRSAEGLSTVGSGLLVQGWAIACMILLIAAMIFIGMMSRAPMRGPGVATATFGVVGIGVLLAAIAMLVGEFMCLAAPAESGAKGLIIATVCCSLVNVIVSIANNVGVPNPVLGLVGGLAGLGRVILFLLFLRAIARYAGFEEHGSRALIILIGLPVSAFLAVLGSLVLPALAGAGGSVGAILFLLLMIGCGIATLVFSVMYVFLLFRLGGDLRR